MACSNNPCAQAAKNIALAGVGSLFLLDAAPATSAAAACNFLVPADAEESQRYTIAAKHCAYLKSQCMHA